jgi:hypothetical protein
MKKERGQSLVELAISILFLLFLLSGAAEFGVLFFQFVQLRDAAQEGALYASSNIPSKTQPDAANTLTKIEDRARNASASPIDLTDTSKVQVSVFVVNKDNLTETLIWRNYAARGSTSIACEGHGVRISVLYNHQIFMPFLPRILNRSYIPLTATVTDTILTPLCSP